MKFKRSLTVCLCVLFAAVFVLNINAQERSRVVRNDLQMPTSRESQPVNNPARPAEIVRRTLSSPVSRPVLTDKIVVSRTSQPLIKKTGSSLPVQPVLSNSLAVNRLAYSSTLNGSLMNSIESKLGIPYRYGSMGPKRYDCSGFVWSVFQDAGVFFERSSARTFWHEFEPVEGDARFQFGTLVFFNKLGHVGIVADENGFYQASSSKGITYSPFKGYWAKRIVGYRRIPASYYQNTAKVK